MENPLVSVIIPTFNRADMVVEAVKSVLKQSYPNFEIIVCDDGSTDNTEELIKPLVNEQVRYLKQENKGPGAARNMGIKASNGKLIAFLDSDDKWLPEHLHYCIEFFNLYPEADMVYTQLEVISQGKKKEHKYKKQEIPFEEKKEDFRLYGGLVFDYYLKGTILNQTSCTVIKKKLLGQIGLFNEDIFNGQDYELWLRISNKFRIGVVRKVTVHYFEHEASISKTVSSKFHLENRVQIFEGVLKNCNLTDEQKKIAEQKLEDTRKKISTL